MNQQAVDWSDGKMVRSFSMDEAEYDWIREQNEKGELIEFDIPEDAPLGKRVSELEFSKEKEQQEPVDPKEIFGED